MSVIVVLSICETVCDVLRCEVSRMRLLMCGNINIEGNRLQGQRLTGGDDGQVLSIE